MFDARHSMPSTKPILHEQHVVILTDSNAVVVIVHYYFSSEILLRFSPSFYFMNGMFACVTSNEIQTTIIVATTTPKKT